MTEPKLSEQFFNDALQHEASMHDHLERDDYTKAEVFEAACNESLDAAVAAERAGR